MTTMQTVFSHDRLDRRNLPNPMASGRSIVRDQFTAASGSRTCLSNSVIHAFNCANADSTNALTAGVISASISGGIVINGGRLQSGIDALTPKSIRRVTSVFFGLSPARERCKLKSVYPKIKR